MSEFHCLATTRNIRLDCTAQAELKILPCCVYQPKQVYSSLDQYNNSEEIQQLRSATNWPTGCKVCKMQEAQGQTSYRNHAEISLKSVNGRRYEIMPSNVCNLRCIMCNSASSTALAHERFSVGLDATNLAREIDVGDQQLEILKQDNNIESISLIGGEFFLSKSNLEFLDFAIERNIPLRVVTNATVLLDRHLEKLKQLDNLELQISTDGYGLGYEYMRYPAKWSLFETNVGVLINNLPKAKINFNFVAQPLNVQQMIPVMNYANHQRRPLRITNLVVPNHLSWAILTEDEKQDITNVLHNQLEQYQLAKPQLHEVQKYLDTIFATEHNQDLRKQFDVNVTAIYSRRNINWPALKESNLHPRVRSTVFYPLN